MSTLITTTVQGVQNIKYDASTTAMTIDSSGRILTTTARPHVFCQGFSSTSNNASSGQTINGITMDGTWKIIRNFSNVYENYGNHYNNATGIFTAPLSGIYMISLGYGLQEDGNKYVGIGVITGGSSENTSRGIRTSWTSNSADTNHGGQISFCKYITSGTEVAPTMRQTDSNVTKPNDGSAEYFHWNVTFLG